MAQGGGAGGYLGANDLGTIYAAGTGVPFQDYTEAANWYRKSADHGDLTGEYNLGELYKNGRGVPQDFAEADFYLTLALNQNVTGADMGWDDTVLANTKKRLTSERGLAEKQLTSEQLEAVRQRIAAWHPLSAAGQAPPAESQPAVSPPVSPSGPANALGGTVPRTRVSHVLSIAQVQEIASKNQTLGKPEKLGPHFTTRWAFRPARHR